MSRAPRQAPRTEGLDERETLDGWLDFHRATLLWKCEGLSPDELKRRAVSPSNLTLLGIVRHMADVERGWFQRVFVGEDDGYIFFTDDRLNDDFDALDSVPIEDVFATFEHECERSRQIVRAAGTLDELSSGERRSPSGDRYSLRWIVTHMIEEYARHNGHADLLREAIDGATGD